jgi:hypothetical protein
MSAIESQERFCPQCLHYQTHTLLSRTPMKTVSAGICVKWTCEIWKCMGCGILKVSTTDSRLINHGEVHT